MAKRSGLRAIRTSLQDFVRGEKGILIVHFHILTVCLEGIQMFQGHKTTNLNPSEVRAPSHEQQDVGFLRET